MSEYDLIVIGGGPGGSTVSTLVAKQGHKVLLLEREEFPRHQIGESLLPATVHGICTMLGVYDELSKQNFPVKLGASFRWGRNPEIWSFDFATLQKIKDANAGWAWQVERAKFDDILLKNAKKNGVDVRMKSSFRELIVENGRAVGVRYVDASGAEQTARAKFIADASGHGSRIHPFVGERTYSKYFQNIALYAYYEGVKRLPPPRSGNILCAAFSEGWFWIIPLSDTLTSIGAVVDKEAASGKMADPDKAMKEFISKCPILQEYTADAKRITEGQYGQYRIRKDYSYTNNHFAKNGVFLIGDAACFIDPVFSSGVHLSTYSALLTARSVNTLLEDPSFDEASVIAEYDTRYRLEFERIYGFLTAFYDMEQDEESYYWTARKYNTTEERSNEAFIGLVSGVSSNEFFGPRAKSGEILTKYVESDAELKSGVMVGAQLLHRSDRVKDALKAEGRGEAVRENGFTVSSDGLHWSKESVVPLQGAFAMNRIYAVVEGDLGPESKKPAGSAPEKG